MAARSESILVAFLAAVTGLPTTAARVVRSRVYPTDSPPALSVNMGQEVPAGDPDMAEQDELLDIEVIALVKDTAGLDTELNTIAAEVYAAITADRTLGLGYVLDTTWAGRSEPDRVDTLEKPATAQSMFFTVHYRHSYTSMES